MMKTLIALFTVAALSACANSPLREPCSIDAAGQQQAMANIAAALEKESRINAADYIQDPFKPFAVYNASSHCDFVLRPWRAVQSEMMWDGALGIRVNKQSLAVEDIYRIDEK